jgi:hypothetical protein
VRQVSEMEGEDYADHRQNGFLMVSCRLIICPSCKSSE